MEAAEFLREEIGAISKQFPQVHFKYSFNKRIFTHIIEMLPIEQYKNNPLLDEAWIPVSFNFRKQFPNDEITFISSDSSLSNENTLFEFNTPRVCAEEEVMSELFANLTESTLHYEFPTQIPGGIILKPCSVDFLRYPIKNDSNLSDAESTYSQAA